MISEKRELKNVPLADLIPYARNPRKNDAAVQAVAASLKEYGLVKNSIVVDEETVLIAGHTTMKAMQALGWTHAPEVTQVFGLTPAQKKAYRIADNRTGEVAEWDADLLALEFEDLQDLDFNIELTGFDEGEIAKLRDVDGLLSEAARATLAEKYLFPPFSVLDARQGVWQERKKAWIEIGIKSEIGRERNLIRHSKISTLGDKDTSIFDPVLCEIIYTWFCPPAGQIIDPFAGGSVRGIVACETGRQYWGCDLIKKQIAANEEQADTIRTAPRPVWIAGDSRDRLTDAPLADLIFSCPPYADLEVYSDDPRDISTMPYPDFKEAYRDIIAKACARLKPDRFACFVVGEVRDKRGNYYDFIGDTVQAFRDAGLQYYNEAILVTAVGSLPIRVGKAFGATRKLGKTHQNVLVFVKGDPKAAADACGPPEVADGR